MFWQFLLYSVVVGMTLGAVALCWERLAVLRGWPRRMVWASAIGASIAGPAIGVLTAGPGVAMQVSGVAAPSASALLVEPAATADATVPTGAGVAAPLRLPPGASQAAGAHGMAQRSPGDTGPAPAAQHLPAAAAAPLLRLLSRVPDTALLGGWILVSAALWLYLLVAAALLHRRAASWRRERVLECDVLVSQDTGPALFGAWRPRIVVPHWFMGLPCARQGLILAHELQHLAARDPLLLRAAQLAVAAMPWNLPLWWQLRRLRLAIEVDCDARVLRGGADAASYGQMLLGVAQRAGAAPLGAVAMSRPRSVLEYRIRNLAPRPVRRAALQAGMAVLLAAAGMTVVVALEAPALITRTAPVQAQAPVHAPQPVPVPSLAGAPAQPGSARPDPQSTAAIIDDDPVASPAAEPVVIEPLPATPLDPGNPAAVADRAVEALVAAHPQLVDGIQRGGWYSGAVVLRADGSVVRTALRHASGRAQAIRDILDLRYIPASTLVRPASRLPASQVSQVPMEARRPGDRLGDGGMLRDNLVFQYAVLPPGTDERRMLLAVWEAVLARHEALLLPRDASVANRLTVLLTEDGQIARERVEVGPRERMLGGSPDFGALGLRPGDIGSWGTTTLTRNDYSDADTAPADQQVIRAALASALQVRDELVVHYAWPRREGEPAGGVAPRRAEQPVGVRAIALALIDGLRSEQPDGLVRADQPPQAQQGGDR